MKKQIFLFAVAALVLASCSSENDVVQTPAAQQTADDGAVLFDSYVNRATTRAGVTGDLKTANLRSTETELGKAGFGVFGYYTNNATYDQQAIPNFFYNEKVWYNGSYFEYKPIKYWPNEYGKTAESEDNDKVTFFAYAPWVEVSPSTGKVIQRDATDNEKIDQEASAKLQKWGITTLSNNSATGDPLVKYLVSFDQDKSVDLCWGVCDGTDTQWNTVESSSTNALQTLTAGLPWLDVQRPAEAKTQDKASQRVRFTFKHATAQLMVKINAFVDGTDNSNPVDGKTKVYVRSITFEGFATKGALNLNNTETGANKAYWMDWTGNNDIVTGESVTIYDGRKDGKEGTPSGEATNEKTLGLNPDLVQSEGWKTSASGVTQELKNLFRKYNESTNEYVAADKPIYVIPTGDDVRVTITYDIETEDDKLSTYVSDVTTHGSSIENVISKDINFGSKDLTALENGKSYIINLHLGMNSVKFDATVTEWVDAETIPDVDLPANVPQFASKEAGSTETYPVELPATTTLYTFAITGLNGGEAVTKPTISSGPFSEPTENAANSSGVAIESITIAPNMTPKNKDAVDLTWTGKSSGKVANMSFTQKAHALELKIESVSGKTITLGAGASGIVWGTHVAAASTLKDGEADDDDAIKVWRNGSRLIFKDSSPKDGQFTYNGTPDKIGLGTAPVLGETYTIYIKAGDAEGEMVTFRIGGPSLSSEAVNIEYGEKYKREPIFYGPAPHNFTWSSDVTGTATVDEYGLVTSVGYNGGGTTTIKLKTDPIEPADGWFYITNDLSYKLNVTRANASISFDDPNPKDKTDIDKEINSQIIINRVILKNSKGNKLTPGADNGGEVVYSIESAYKEGESTNLKDNFNVDNSGIVTVKTTALDATTTYSVVVKAVVTSNSNAKYGDTATTDKTYTIKFTTKS